MLDWKANTNVSRPVASRPGQFVSLQLSFSTADVERMLFVGAQRAPTDPQPTPLAEKYLVIHGEVFRVEEERPYPDAVPLTPDSGLVELTLPR